MTTPLLVILLVLLWLGYILGPTDRPAVQCAGRDVAACAPVPTPGVVDVERMGRR